MPLPGLPDPDCAAFTPLNSRRRSLAEYGLRHKADSLKGTAVVHHTCLL